MEQTYFYLTITGNGNAHKIKEQYNLNEFQAHNKGDYDVLPVFAKSQKTLIIFLIQIQWVNY